MHEAATWRRPSLNCVIGAVMMGRLGGRPAASQLRGAKMAFMRARITHYQKFAGLRSPGDNADERVGLIRASWRGLSRRGSIGAAI